MEIHLKCSKLSLHDVAGSSCAQRRHCSPWMSDAALQSESAYRALGAAMVLSHDCWEFLMH